MQIKKVAINTIDEIGDLEQKCFSFPWSKEQLLSHLEHDNPIYSYYLDTKIVAYAIIASTKYESEIYKIATLPQYRKQGIAKNLLLSIINEFPLDHSFF